MKKSHALNEQISVTEVDVNSILAAIQSAVKADKKTVESMARENRQIAYEESAYATRDPEFWDEEEEEEEVVWNDPTDM